MKTILIVGASRGLGLGLVAEHLKRGFDVIATVRKAADEADLKALPGAERLTLHHLDVTSDDDIARLDYYEGGFGYALAPVTVQTAAGDRAAQVYLPPAGGPAPGAPWDLAAWVRLWGPAAVATAGDVMALRGERPADQVARRYANMLVRGASRVRAAAEPAPTALRRPCAPGDVAVARRTQPYAHYFAVEEYDLAFRRFDGSLSPVVNRAVFVSGDAVTVLPYDPARDRVLLVEQFRAGPFARGDRQPWQLEPIAGRIDPEETAEDCARREAQEEAGLTLGPLLQVASYYPSPGAKSEFLISYVAPCDLPDGTAIVSGVEGEAEDIRGHLLAFADLMALVASGEVANGPLVLTALWLDRERPRLRAAAGA
ncbi:MAG: NUDIX domain-containing protein [Rhodobacterales bacterium]|nr:NUDIX domain-containing protein [Rhodobacterales bacterium]